MVEVKNLDMSVLDMPAPIESTKDLGLLPEEEAPEVPELKATVPFDRVDFSPSYMTKIMRLFPTEPDSSTKKSSFGDPLTSTHILAIDAASQFNNIYPGNSYVDLRNGTHNTPLFEKGVKLNDDIILRTLTTLKDKKFFSSLGRRSLELTPSSIAFGAGFKATKEAVDRWLPPVLFDKKEGLVPIDLKSLPAGAKRYARIAEGGYLTLKYISPFVGGIASSILTAEPGEDLSNLILGEKSLATPKTYATQKSAETLAEFGLFAPYALIAERAATNTLADYFTNRLALGKNYFGRDFDIYNKNISFREQFKNAKRTVKSLGRKDGVPVQGPLTINDLNERGVAAMLQGKVPKASLRSLLVIENALRRQGAENKKLMAFYEALAAGAASSAMFAAAGEDPFTFKETIAEFSAGLFTPIGAHIAIGRFKFMKDLTKKYFTKVGDEGFLKGSGQFLIGGLENVRNAKAFSLIVQELEKLGSIDNPKQLEELINRLESVNVTRTKDGKPATMTAGQVTQDPALLALEAALARDFPALSSQRKQALLLEQEALTVILNKLSNISEGALGKESAMLAGEIREAIFKRDLDSKLSVAENNIINAFNQVRMGGKADEEKLIAGLEKAGVDFKDVGGIENFDGTDLTQLSVLLARSLENAMNISKNQRQKLYNKVPMRQITVDEFFEIDDNGEAIQTDVPKFIRLLREEGPFGKFTKIRSELSGFFRYSQDISNKLGLGIDLGTDTPKKDAFEEAYKNLIGADALKNFDLFMTKLGAYGEDVQITPEMINEVRIKALNVSSKRPDVKKLYTTKMEAMIESLDNGSQKEPTIFGINLKELDNYRSDALSIARNSQKYDAATRMLAGQIAEALEDDIANFAAYGSGGMTNQQRSDLLAARAFHKAHSDVYKRSFVGEVLKKDQEGAFKMDHKTLFDKLFTERFAINQTNFEDIQAVGEFAKKQGLIGAEDTVNTLVGLQNKILRNVRAFAYDVKTKTYKKEKIEQWLDNNKNLETVFPDVFNDLRNFDNANVVLNNVIDKNNTQLKHIKSQMNFGALLRNAKGDLRSSPTAAIQEALTAGKDVWLKLDALINVIPKKGEELKQKVWVFRNPDNGNPIRIYNQKEANDFLSAHPNFDYKIETLTVDRDKAIEGFKDSFFEYLMYGGGTQGKLKRPDVIYQELFVKQITPTIDPSLRGARRKNMVSLTLAEFLTQKGIFTETDVKTARSALEGLIKTQTSDLTDLIGTDFQEARPLIDFGLGVFGSAVGTRSQALFTGGQGGPGSIIAAGKGAEAMRNIFLRIPQSQKSLLTAKLLQDPELLAKMLREYGDDETTAMGLVQSITNYLKKQGFTILPFRSFQSQVMTDDVEKDEEGQFNPFAPELEEPIVKKDPTIETSAVVPEPRVSPVQTPNPLLISQNLPQARPQPAAASGPVDRTKYAALFPNDMASSMIKGGIGGLMG
jgi:hypothetical protein